MSVEDGAASSTNEGAANVSLRDYQLEAIRKLGDAWTTKPILVAPCGSGKTTIAAEIIRRAVEKGNTCVFLVHRIELVDQAIERLAEFGIEAGQIVAGRKQKPSPVQVASIQTLARRHPPHFKVVIVDECSHAVSPSWKRIIDHYAAAGSAVLGLTATPFRLDGKGLGAVFGSLVVATTATDLIARGLLVEPVVYAPKPPDLSGIRTIGGDYANDELAARMTQEGIVGKLVEHWQQLALGRKTVCFAVNVAHSEYVCHVFREHGVRAEHLDGATPRSERAEILARLKRGELDIVSNCMVLTEGWDLPSLECALIARPTKSLALWIQMQGRIMRACPDKAGAIVLDHAGNTLRLGLVTDPLEYDLHDRVHRVGEGAPRTCPKCYAVISKTDTTCPHCSAALVDAAEREKREVRYVDGELVKFERRVPNERYAELVTEAWRMNRRLGWARHAYKNEFGVWPRGMKDVEARLYPCVDHVSEVAVYGGRHVERCSRCMREIRDAPEYRGGPDEGWMR